MQIISFNPTALRTAKTPRSFGCSECNRVNSAIGLKVNPTLEWPNHPGKKTDVKIHSLHKNGRKTEMILRCRDTSARLISMTSTIWEVNYPLGMSYAFLRCLSLLPV